MRSTAVAFTILLVLAAACQRADEAIEASTSEIEFESVDLPGRLWDPLAPDIASGQAVVLQARLSIPAANDPVPAVIIAHGCGGVSAVETDWSDELAAAGISTLVVDSFSGRRIGQICSGAETINVLSSVIDVFRAAEVLRDDPRIDESRIAVMGLSFGGRAALWSAYERFIELYDGREFAAHIAFYPSTCYIELADETTSRAPIRLFHGTDDDWTPIDQCRDMAERLSSEGADIELFEYQGAAHGFDNRSLGWSSYHYFPSALSPRNCSFVERDGQIVEAVTGLAASSRSDCVDTGVTVSFDRAAREAAADDLLTLLTDVLQP